MAVEKIIRKVKSSLPTSARKVLFDLKLKAKSAVNDDGKEFEPYDIEREVFGEKLKLHIGNAEGKLWYDDNAFGDELWEEVAFLKDKMLSPDDVVFDCGAHHGMMTVLLSKWLDTGTVTAFDPVPDNVEFVKKNLELNQIENVNIIHAAVGAEQGEVTFSDGSNASVGFGNKSNVTKVITLDDFAYRKPTFLKIDVEGYETQVLQGATKILEDHPKIMMEVHGNLLDLFDTNVDEVMSFIDPEIYEIWIQWGEWDKPQPYTPDMKIGDNRVHIFAIPKK